MNTYTFKCLQIKISYLKAYHWLKYLKLYDLQQIISIITE